MIRTLLPTIVLCTQISYAQVCASIESFELPTEGYGVGILDYRGMIAADLDNDGDLDIATGNKPNGGISIILNNGDATFQEERLIEFGEGAWTLDTIDYDRDGDLDFIVCVRPFALSTYLAIMLNNGDATFGQPFAPTNIPQNTTRTIQNVLTEDVNGDSFEDVIMVFSNDRRKVEVSYSLSPSVLSVPVDYRTDDINVFAKDIGITDVNGDSHPDIVFWSSGGGQEGRGVGYFPNTGDGTFLDPITISGSNSLQVYPTDVDLDGDMDLIVNPESGLLNTLINDGSGNFSNGSLVAPEENVKGVLVVDLDMNGADDVVITTTDSNQLGIAMRSCNGFLNEFRFIDTLGTLEFLITADLDNDSDPDVAVYTDENDQVEVYRNMTSTCPVDLNGDGLANFFDVSVFMSDSVDYLADGSFNFLDVVAYLTDFSAGCP
jgi:FG-GAP-like repeat